MPTSIRSAAAADEAFLRETQYVALFVPPGAESYPKAIVDEPGICRNYAGFGMLPGDLGCIAEDGNGDPIGAAWVRYSSSDDPRYRDGDSVFMLYQRPH